MKTQREIEERIEALEVTLGFVQFTTDKVTLARLKGGLQTLQWVLEKDEEPTR